MRLSTQLRRRDSWEARLKARNCWLRSANRANGNNVGYVNANGNCNNNNAYNGNRAAPDCVYRNAFGLHEVMAA